MLNTNAHLTEEKKKLADAQKLAQDREEILRTLGEEGKKIMKEFLKANDERNDKLKTEQDVQLDTKSRSSSVATEATDMSVKTASSSASYTSNTSKNYFTRGARPRQSSLLGEFLGYIARPFISVGNKVAKGASSLFMSAGKSALLGGLQATRSVVNAPKVATSSGKAAVTAVTRGIGRALGVKQVVKPVVTEVYSIHPPDTTPQTLEITNDTDRSQSH